MIIEKNHYKLIILLLFLMMGISACHTRKASIVYQKESNTPSIDPIHTLAKNPNAEMAPVNKPRLGFTQYLNYVNAYIQNYSPIAIQEMKQYGVPASIILAQGIHESGAGKSNLATQANNHFGVKCTSDWTGQGYTMDDDKPNECFRKYSSPLESFQDHMAFLQRKRYANLFSLGSSDYKAWAYGLKTCGYATNPNYPQVLIGLIQKYNLNRFDEDNSPVSGSQNPELAGKKPISLPRNNPVIIHDTIHRKVYKTDTVFSIAYSNGPSKGRSEGTHYSSYPSGNKNPLSDTLKINTVIQSRPMSVSANSIPLDSNFYSVRQGDTLYSIARRFNLSIDQIKELNQLPDAGIKIDQVLRIKP